MAMSKKDYTKFAALFAGEVSLATEVTKVNLSAGLDKMTVVRNIIFSSADIFAQDNPRFDRQRFYTACGI